MISKFRIESSFFKNVATLMKGTVLSQIIAILIIPVLSRLYSSEDFGELAIVMAFGQMAGVILALRYEMAVMLPKKDIIAFQILIKSIIIIFIMTLLEALLLNIFFQYYLKSYSSLLYIIVLCSFFTIFFQLLILWFNRQKKFDLSAKMSVVKVLVIFIFQYMFSNEPQGMVYGYMVGNLVVFIILFIFFIRSAKKFGLHISKRKMGYILKRYRKFPIYSVPASFMNSAAKNIQFILIEQLFGTASAGILSMITRLVYAPVALIGATVNNVVYQHFTKEISHKKPIYFQMQKITLVISLIGVVVTIFILLVYKLDLLTLILGDNWSNANSLLVYFTPLIFSAMVATSIARFAIFEKQEIGMFFQALSLVCVIVSIVLGEYLFKEFEKTIIVYAIVLSILYILQLNISLLLAKNYDKHLKGKDIC